jgi:hypothetical protein
VARCISRLLAYFQLRRFFPGTTGVTALAVQVFLQSYGIVVFAIVGAIDQCNQSFGGCRPQRPPALFIFIELTKISMPEFVPPRRIVVKPSA